MQSDVVQPSPNTESPERMMSRFIERIAPAYLERAAAPRSTDLAAWRRGRAIPLLNQLHGVLSGYRRRRWGVIGERMVWLEGGNPKGQPILLLHGFGMSKENWLPILPFLGSRYRVLLLDLPGWGESHFSVGENYGLEAQAQRVEAWRNAVLNTPVHVVGSSMGGAVAKLFNALHPTSVRTLTLMNALGLPGENQSDLVTKLAQGKNTLVPDTAANVKRLASLAIRGTSLPHLLTPLIAPELIARRHVNEHLFQQMLQHTPDFNRMSFDAITNPVLVIWGSDDQVLDVSAVDSYFTAFQNVKIKVFSGVGHLPMVEVPRRCAQALRKFWLFSECASSSDFEYSSLSEKAKQCAVW